MAATSQYWSSRDCSISELRQGWVGTGLGESRDGG